MDYKKLINDEFKKANAAVSSVDKSLTGAEILDIFDSTLKEYEEATEIIVNRLNEESPESVPDAELLISEKRELIVRMPE